MKIDTIEEVLAKRDDEVVVAFKGTVKSASKHIPADPKKKDSQSIQVITLADEAGKEIRAILKNRAPFDPAMVGKLVYLYANKGTNGWVGIVAKDEKNKLTKATERILRVTAPAEIIRVAKLSELPLEGRDAPAPASGPSGGQKPLVGHPEAVSGGLKPGSNRGKRGEYIDDGAPAMETDPGAAADRLTEAEAVAEGQRQCWRNFNAMRLALRMAEKTRLAYTEDSGKELWPEHFRVITSSFFIALNNSGVTRWLPSRPVALDELMAKADADNKANLQAEAAKPPAAPPGNPPPGDPAATAKQKLNAGNPGVGGDDVPW